MKSIRRRVVSFFFGKDHEAKFKEVIANVGNKERNF